MLSNLRLVLSRRFSTKIKTVDLKEINFFGDAANQWWNQSGGCGPLHALNNRRIPWIHNRLKEIGVIRNSKNAPLEGLSVLDVGCGGGILTEELSRLGCDTTGLDYSQELINVARSHAKTQNLPNLRYICSSIQDHAVQNKGKYDVVVSSEVIEHVTEKDDFVKFCVRCLKPGGSIFITTPNKTWLSRFFVIFAMENMFKSIPKGTHTYDMFIHVDELKEILRKEKCKTLYTRGLIYNPFKNEWNWVDNMKYFCYVIHAVKMT